MNTRFPDVAPRDLNESHPRLQLDASAGHGLTRRAHRASDSAHAAPEASATAPLSRAERRRLGLATDATVLPSAGTSASETSAPAFAIEPVRAAAPLSRRAARLASVSDIDATSSTDAADAPTDVVELLIVDAAEDITAPPRVADNAASRGEAKNEPDAFARAARVFSFTGETPIVPSSFVRTEADGSADEDSRVRADRAARRSPRRPRRRVSVQRAAAACFSVGVMSAVGLLALGTAAPAEAIAAALNRDAPMSVRVAAPTAPAVEDDEIQAFVSSSVDTELNRSETYQTATFEQLAEQTGITNYSNFFVNDASAPVQWPFAVGVPITDTWGPRWGSFHHGVDFTPGEGADIQAVADGTVRIATENGGLYGVYVVVDHEIDGHQVSSLYAHMLRGSMKVQPGDTVKVGDVLGNTGNTGMSYGAHTHFEITLDGVRVDPLQWLRENAGG